MSGVLSGRQVTEELTEILRHVSEHVVNRERRVEDHASFADLHPELRVSETARKAHLVPVELEDVSRATDGDDAFSSFPRFDCKAQSRVEMVSVDSAGISAF